MSRRSGLAVAIVLLWTAGIGMLVHREYFRSAAQRLETAALRVEPRALFYRVDQGGAQIGFASSTVDTTATTILITDYFIADLPVEGAVHRATVNSTIHLSRALRLRDFKLALGSESGPLTATGRMDGDSVLVFSLTTAGVPADTERVRTGGPLLLPTVVPLAVALGERPKIGKRFTLSIFDPVAMAPKPLTLRVRAESLFVLSDSAAFDSTTRRWVPATRDTVRAWRIEPESGNGISGWVDEQGRLVQASQAGLVLRRMAYELAYQNWRLEGTSRAGGSSRVTADSDIQETTAIAANIPAGGRRVHELRVRLSNVELGGYDLAGARQTLSGDTLTVTREGPGALVARYTLSGSGGYRNDFVDELASEPLLQVRHPRIVALARRLAAGETDPRVVAERINRWVYDSLEKEITIGLPNAIQVLESGSGDCNEHTQLFVALARAAGIPSRAAAGLAFVRGKFYYHAWPEVYLDTWVAVDPTFGQFPADAAHLRFVIGGLARQAEMLRLIGNLGIDVVSIK